MAKETGTAEGWLVVVDLQNVFRDPETPWTTPRFEEIRPRIRRRLWRGRDTAL